jgi:hypothetical protein
MFHCSPLYALVVLRKYITHLIADTKTLLYIPVTYQHYPNARTHTKKKMQLHMAMPLIEYPTY